MAHFKGTLAPPLVRSELFSIKSVFIKMKAEDGSWTELEDRIPTRTKPIFCSQSRNRRSWTNSEQARSIPSAIAGIPRNGYGSLLASFVDDSVQYSPSTSIDDASLESRTVTVALPSKRSANMKSEFRFAVRYSGGVEIESDSLSYQLPPIGMYVSLHTN